MLNISSIKFLKFLTLAPACRQASQSASKPVLDTLAKNFGESSKDIGKTLAKMMSWPNLDCLYSARSYVLQSHKKNAGDYNDNP